MRWSRTVDIPTPLIILGDDWCEESLTIWLRWRGTWDEYSWKIEARVRLHGGFV